MKKQPSNDLLDVLNAMEDGVYIIRSDYTVEFMNHAMVEIFGDGTGRKCYEVVNKSSGLCPWCQASDVFEDGEIIHSETHVPCVDRSFRITDLPIRNRDGSIFKMTFYRDISDEKRQELRLKASEEDYRRLFRHVGVGVYVSSKKGRFLDANPALLKMLGYDSKESFLNINIQNDLYVRPDDRLAFQRMIEKDGRVIDYNVNFKRMDGTVIPVLLTANVRHDHEGRVIGYEGIMTDRSRREAMEQKLRAAHDFLNNIIRSSPNAIMGTDMKGNIIIWNRGAEETLGYTAEEVVEQMSVRALYPEGMAKKVMKMIRGPESGGPGKLRAYPMTFRHVDGAVVEGTLSANIIYDQKGNEVASVGIFVDIGERLEMERKLHRTQEHLLQSEKLAAMGRLISHLAHELNNPLYGIMNTLELMKTEIPPTNKRRKLLDMALSETVRLTDMLRKTLSFSKPDQEEKAPVRINDILDEILLLHEKQLREHTIKTVSDFAADLPEVIASKNQLRQVFLNLISNARDAMPEGGTFRVSTESQGDQIVIRVSDTGVGIKEEHLDKIFDTFFSTKTDSVKGVGLGLSVCYGFIKDHGGDIQVESRRGTGTTFIIRLPVLPPKAE
ncbi:MAG: PAS domain S-box protein [Deltaproteobacteria bacterium]|nr:PAS domain S-box protein [Deltaproteobacteria bacterium]